MLTKADNLNSNLSDSGVTPISTLSYISDCPAGISQEAVLHRGDGIIFQEDGELFPAPGNDAGISGKFAVGLLHLLPLRTDGNSLRGMELTAAEPPAQDPVSVLGGVGAQVEGTEIVGLFRSGKGAAGGLRITVGSAQGFQGILCRRVQR